MSIDTMDHEGERWAHGRMSWLPQEMLDKLGKLYVVMLVRNCLVRAWRVAFSRTWSIHLLPFL